MQCPCVAILKTLPLKSSFHVLFGFLWHSLFGVPLRTRSINGVGLRDWMRGVWSGSSMAGYVTCGCEYTHAGAHIFTYKRLHTHKQTYTHIHKQTHEHTHTRLYARTQKITIIINTSTITCVESGIKTYPQEKKNNNISWSSKATWWWDQFASKRYTLLHLIQNRTISYG